MYMYTVVNTSGYDGANVTVKIKVYINTENKNLQQKKVKSYK